MTAVAHPAAATLDADAFGRLAESLADVGRDLCGRGWAPATSANYSIRLDHRSCVITASGLDKCQLTPADALAVDLDGQPLSPGTPSAETALHLQIYRRHPGATAVLHTHSHNATLIGRVLRDRSEVVLEGYELLKAFAGVESHEARLVVPIFENSQDIASLAAEIDRYEDAHGAVTAYVLRGHGAYAWGCCMPDAIRHLEALELLLGVELDLMRCRP